MMDYRRTHHLLIMHPPSPVYVPYVLELAYPEFMLPEDDVLPAEEQPLPDAISLAADSPGYITESDPEEDPEEDDEDPEEDLADYPTDRDDDKEEEESFRDNVNDEEEDEDEDEEEEEHLASADNVPPPACQVDRFLAISAPLLPTSPTHPLGYRADMIRLRAESPSTSHLLPLPLPIVLSHTRASIAMMRDVAPSTYILAPRSEAPPSETPPLLPIPLPTSSPPLLLPSTDCRADATEVTLPPQKRLYIAPGSRYKVGESSSAPTARSTGGFRANYGFVSTLDAEIRRDLDREIGYRITNTWDEMVEDMQGTLAVTDVAELSQRKIDFLTTVR
ncbi:hypothetical protein Tco_1040369 [Tanacetum coccineum]